MWQRATRLPLLLQTLESTCLRNWFMHTFSETYALFMHSFFERLGSAFGWIRPCVWVMPRWFSKCKYDRFMHLAPSKRGFTQTATYNMS